MKKRSKGARPFARAANAALAVALSAGLCPTVALASPVSDTNPDGVFAVAGADDQSISLLASAAQSQNAGAHEYTNLARWAQPTASYLHATANGIERVEYIDSGTIPALVVESYTGSAPDYTLASSRTISSSTYAPSGTPSNLNVLWGGFFAGASYNFVVTGQENPNESDSVAVVRITKYDKNWNYLDAAELRGANTTIPFNAGSLDMAEIGDTLYVKTCHSMYASEKDGLNHQASMTIVVNESSMAITDSEYNVLNVDDTRYGYVSHSFNQMLAVSGGGVWSVDHGDAYPRTIVLKKFGSSGHYDVYDIWGGESQIGANDTGVSLGGFEAASGNRLLVAYSAVDKAAVSSVSDLYRMPRRVYVAAVNASNGSVANLTQPTSGQSLSTSEGNPMLVKINDDKFLLLWENLASPTSRPNGSISYVFVNGSGVATSQVYRASASLSDCQPIVVGGKALWYVTGASGSASEPIFYAIDASTGSLTSSSAPSSSYDLFDATLSGISQSYAYTGSPITPAPTVAIGTTVLTPNVHYTTEYYANTNAGTATIVISGIAPYVNGQSITFAIAPASISSAEVYVELSYPYEGKPVEPKPVVAFNGQLLLSGEDYTYTYRNNNAVGTGQIVLTGKGNFTGTATCDFAIVESGSTPDPGVDPDPIPGGSFSDVPEGYWGEGDIYTAVELGLMSGDRTSTGALAGTFRPEANITRGEVATILFRHANPSSAATSDPAAYENNTTGIIYDVPDKQFYTAAMNWAFKEGIMKGDRDAETDELVGTMRPNDNITREEVATMLARYADWSGTSTSGFTADFLFTPDGFTVSPFAMNSMAWCFDQGIMKGDANTGFLSPHNPATRAQMAKMIVTTTSILD